MRSLRPTQRRIRPVSLALTAGSILAVSAVLAVSASASTPPSSSDWAQTDGTAGHTHANLTETTLTRKTVKNVELLRQLKTPAPTGNCAAGTSRSPVLAGGDAYDIAGGWVTAYKASTGAVIWRHDLDADATDLSNDVAVTSLAVANGLVIVGGNECDSYSDPNGILYGFDAATGAPVWHSTGGFGAIDDFVVSGDRIVSAGTSPGSGTVVSAFNLSTGVAEWTQGTDASCGVTPVALVVHRRVTTPECVTDADVDGDSAPALVGLIVATGTPVWSKPGRWTVLAGTTHDANGRLYATSSGGLLTDLNPANGNVRFTIRAATTLLAVDDSKLYAVCGVRKVCGYSETTGTELWQVANPSRVAADAGGVLYLSDGKVLRTSTGKTVVRLWRAAASIAVGDGRIAITEPQTQKLRLFGLAD